MLSPNKVPAKVEKITDNGMRTQKSLSLFDRFELAHSSLPDPAHLVRLLCPIILVPFSAVNRVGHDISLSYRIDS
jgi:hypothetical protein